MGHQLQAIAGYVPTDLFEQRKWASQHLPALDWCSFLLWMWRNWPAYTVKGNAIKCFRSLDYEQQIALSGLKWQDFSHRGLMESIFKPFSFLAPLKTSAGLATRSYQDNSSPVNITINQRWNQIPTGIIKGQHLFSWYCRIYNKQVQLLGQTWLTSGDSVIESLQASYTSAHYQ